MTAVVVAVVENAAENGWLMGFETVVCAVVIAMLLWILPLLYM